MLSLAVAVVKVTTEKPGQKVATKAEAVTVGVMGLSPARGDYAYTLGQTYPVGILVDSKSAKIDGVDVIINFDPAKAEVVGGVSAGNLFERAVLNQIDNETGQIRFSALSFDAKPVTGIAATFSFRPKAAGEVDFNFDFKPGVTTDSNMAENGTAKDILGKVENGKYNFK